MRVRRLETVRYPPDGSHYQSESVRPPAWQEIEAAIRRLDHHEFPQAFLFLDEDDYETNCLWICGGPRGYHLNASFGSALKPWHEYLEPTQGDQEIDVWTSDQGFSAPDRNVCHDLDLVLRIARFFADCGHLAPFVRWT